MFKRKWLLSSPSSKIEEWEIKLAGGKSKAKKRRWFLSVGFLSTGYCSSQGFRKQSHVPKAKSLRFRRRVIAKERGAGERGGDNPHNAWICELRQSEPRPRELPVQGRHPDLLRSLSLANTRPTPATKRWLRDSLWVGRSLRKERWFWQNKEVKIEWLIFSFV